MSGDNLPVALVALIPVLVFFLWQFWQSLNRFAGRPYGRRVTPRALIAGLGLIALILFFML